MNVEIIAAAMVDLAEKGTFDRSFVCVLSRKGAPTW